ncbi:MAG TPA: serine O-acetyltransferase [Clostridiales bacterium UBA8153]|nr:serine O-acetyltransferase [Clostridiales bacterium UBA8153]
MSSWFRQGIDAIMARDPATRSRLEAALCTPGLHALLFHRVGHFLYHKRMVLLARLISQLGRFLTGVEIHPGAVIGEGVFIDHGAGVVIGETAVIGDQVTLYQGVTLGGTGKEKGKRHPTIGRHVIIGAGATILGPITIGEGARVGAGSVVVHPVPPHCTVVGVPGRILQAPSHGLPATGLEHGELPDPDAHHLGQLREELARLQREVNALVAQLEGADPPPKAAAGGVH